MKLQLKINREQKVWGSIILINMISIYISMFESVADPERLFCWGFVLLFGSIFLGLFLAPEP